MVAQRPLRVHVDDVHDDAARRAQRRDERLRQEQRRFQVAAEKIVPLLERDRADRRGIEVRRVVDEDVELAAGAVEHLRGQPLYGSDVEDVGADRECRLRSRAIETGRELIRLTGGAVVMDRDVRTRRVQGARNDGADALRCAGDERPSTLEARLSCGTGHLRSNPRSPASKVTLSSSHDFSTMSRAELPVPSDDARGLSAALTAKIRDEIERAGGWIDFARYMELALYAPGLGYYSAGSTKLGAAGDFVTAPEISRSFGSALALTLDAELAAPGPSG